MTETTVYSDMSCVRFYFESGAHIEVRVGNEDGEKYVFVLTENEMREKFGNYTELFDIHGQKFYLSSDDCFNQDSGLDIEPGFYKIATDGSEWRLFIIEP